MYTHERTYNSLSIVNFSRNKKTSATQRTNKDKITKVSAGIRRGKVFKDQSPRIQNPSGHQGTKVPVSALPDRRRSIARTAANSPDGAQLQLTIVVPPVEVRHVRPVGIPVELEPRKVREG